MQLVAAIDSMKCKKISAFKAIDIEVSAQRFQLLKQTSQVKKPSIWLWHMCKKIFVQRTLTETSSLSLWYAWLIDYYFICKRVQDMCYVYACEWSSWFAGALFGFGSVSTFNFEQRKAKKGGNIDKVA